MAAGLEVGWAGLDAGSEVGLAGLDAGLEVGLAGLAVALPLPFAPGLGVGLAVGLAALGPPCPWRAWRPWPWRAWRWQRPRRRQPPPLHHRRCQVHPRIRLRHRHRTAHHTALLRHRRHCRCERKGRPHQCPHRQPGSGLHIPARTPSPSPVPRAGCSYMPLAAFGACCFCVPFPSWRSGVVVSVGVSVVFCVVLCGGACYNKLQKQAPRWSLFWKQAPRWSL